MSVILLSSCSLFRSEEKNYMWKVEDENSHVFMLGSIHLGKPEIFPLDSVIEDAFKQADYLVVEINVENVNPMSVILQATYKGDTTLKSQISGKSFEKISAIFNEFGIPEANFNKFKPWFAIMTAMQLKLNAEGYKPDDGIDYYFLNKAKVSNKEVLELESFEDQIKLLSAFDGMADDYFAYSIDELNSSVESVDEMYKYWLRGDTTGISKILESGKELDGYETFNENLLVKRNHKMTRKIEEYLAEDKNCFIIIGAAHYIGKDGILNLLKKENKYKIIQK